MSLSGIRFWSRRSKIYLIRVLLLCILIFFAWRYFPSNQNSDNDSEPKFSKTRNLEAPPLPLINEKFRIIARYEEICGLDSYKPEDFYQVVQNEIEQDKPLPDIDLATVLLPSYSNLPLNNISNVLFFTSAFLTHSDNQTRLTIIGIANHELYCNRAHRDRSLFCAFESDSQMNRSTASIECIEEGHGHINTAAILRCSAPNHVSKVRVVEKLPTGVEYSSEQIRITNQEPKRNQTSKEITVCVKSLIGHINVLNLLEFIAYYQANGIDRIALYHYDFEPAGSNQSQTQDRATRFLQFFGSLPGVQLNSFTFPEQLNHRIHSFGQLVTIHDCLLRYPQSVQIHVDLDEFISTQKGSLRSWIEAQQKYVALSIANVFHCNEFNLKSGYYEFEEAAQCGSENRQCSIGIKNQFYQLMDRDSAHQALLAGSNQLCQQSIWPHRARSKVIVLYPRLARHVGIHQMWQFQNDALDQLHGFQRVNNIDPSEAVLRHYRWCCSECDMGFYINQKHAYAVRDQVINATAANSTVKQQSSGQFIKQVQLFVLKHFRQFLNSY